MNNPSKGLNPKDLVGAKKAPLGLVPPALEIGAAEAMAIGAVKYDPFNWRQTPIQYMTYLEAMKRHILALIDGQDLAEDSGVHHLKHVAAGAGIVLDAMAIPGGLVDNRPPKGPAADLLRAQDKSTAVKPRFKGYGGTGDRSTRSARENAIYGPVGPIVEVDPEFNPGWVMGPEDELPYYVGTNVEAGE